MDIHEPVTVDVSDGIVTVTMRGPRGNALSPTMVKALSLALYRAEQALGDIDAPAAHAVVLRGKPGVFCSGLDLKEGDTMERGAVAAWVDAFDALFLQLFAFRAPVIAALEGPAIAGGAVLALACDERVVSTSGPFELGLNEVSLNLSFPAGALEIARHALPSTVHFDALVRGRRFGREEALSRGLVDAVVVDPVAEAWMRARSFSDLGARAVSKTKLDLRYDALTRARARAIESRRIFVEAFFDPIHVAKRRAVLARLATRDVGGAADAEAGTRIKEPDATRHG
jgi:enoyl-CoA hydratase